MSNVVFWKPQRLYLKTHFVLKHGFTYVPSSIGLPVSRFLNTTIIPVIKYNTDVLELGQRLEKAGMRNLHKNKKKIQVALKMIDLYLLLDTKYKKRLQNLILL